jgi:hypothetical protein
MLLVTQTVATTGCNVDLTTQGLPLCFQDCEMWCWATVIAEFQTYYAHGLQSSKNYCHDSECAVVSDVVGKDCCAASSGPHGQACGGPSTQCGAGLEIKAIRQEMSKRIPGRNFILKNGPPSEDELQQALLRGDPILRNVPGHVDAIVGCRQGSNGIAEYKVVDSLGGGGGDPDKAFWWASYNDHVYNGGTTKVWQESIYSTTGKYLNATVVV